MNPSKFILLCLAGWINREQQAVIEYLQEEIRMLKEIHGKRPRFNDQPPASADVRVRRRERIGGLLNYYHREAA